MLQHSLVRLILPHQWKALLKRTEYLVLVSQDAGMCFAKQKMRAE